MSKSNPGSQHWSPETFRRHGHAAIDWLADYMTQVESLPVMAGVKPGDIRNQLPDQAPTEPEAFEDIMSDLDTVLVPGLMNWQSPNFFGYFPANTSPPSILGELLSAGLGQQGMLWQTSPAATELETQVLDWMVAMLGLPETFLSTGIGGGVIQDSASSATLCALLAARERSHTGSARLDGIDSAMVAYCSTETHSSMEKAMAVAGLGRSRLRKIETDKEQRLSVAALEQTILEDLDRGLKPIFVCATVGTTSTLAIDPVDEIGALCARHHIWLHVDAAMAGTAALCDEFRSIHKGVETADSYCVNPHKWMLTNFDCDCFYVADREPLIAALTVLPEYLRNEASEKGDVIDYRDWQIPLGRRFRALKLWMVIRSYGVKALQQLVRKHVELATNLAAKISNDARFELAAEPNLNLLCFRMRGSDRLNQRLLARLNESGRLFLTHTVIGGQFALRVCIGQTYTELRHVDAAWEEIQLSATELEGEGQ